MSKRRKRPKRQRRSYYFEAPWVPGGVYHVYSAAVEPNRLFGEPAHQRFFVELLRDRVACFAEVFAYALLVNHFHLAVRLPSAERLRADILSRAAVLERFGGLAAFYRRHEAYVRQYGHRIAAFDERLYFAPQQDIPAEAPAVEFLHDATPPPS